MIKRKIVEIDQDKCNGCGLCIDACHEGAIQLVDDKAVLISDKYCDGLGDCLPACPTGAITIIEREADAYSEEAVQALKKEKALKVERALDDGPSPCGCPGMRAKKINNTVSTVSHEHAEMPSQLRQWPMQLRLVNTQADYLDGADLLIAADCTAFAHGDFHRSFIKGRITLIGCPKLDDNHYYREKLTQILMKNNIRSITVVRMEVPCCGGIVYAVREAMLASQKIVPYQEITLGINGQVLNV